jgi:hypothetical protein
MSCSTIALCQLLGSPRPSVNSLQVKGDLIVDESDTQGKRGSIFHLNPYVQLMHSSPKSS